LTPVLVVLACAFAAATLVRRLRAGVPVDGPERLLRAATATALASGAASSVVAGLLLGLGSPAAASSPAIVVAAAVALGAAGVAWARSRRGGEAPSGHLPPAGPVAPRWLAAAVAVAGVAIAVAFVLRVRAEPEGHMDALGFWNLRARLLLRGGGDPGVVFPTHIQGNHPDYPLHLPGAVAAGWWALGEEAWWFPAANAALWLAILVAAVGAWASRERGSAAGCAAVLVVLAAPQVVDAASWLYADVPIAALTALSLAWLRAASTGLPGAAGRALALSGACAGLAAWTKNDGCALLVALALVVLARPPAALRRPAAVARLAAGAGAFAALALAFKLTLAPPNDLVESVARRGVLWGLTDGSRYLRIVDAFVGEVFRWTHWHFLVTAMLALAVLPRRGAPARTGRAWAVVLLAALGYGGVYVMARESHVGLPISNSLHRLLLHLWPAIAVLSLVRVWPRLVGIGNGGTRAAVG
jgi:hypothetical protein